MEKSKMLEALMEKELENLFDRAEILKIKLADEQKLLKITNDFKLHDSHFNST